MTIRTADEELYEESVEMSIGITTLKSPNKLNRDRSNTTQSYGTAPTSSFSTSSGCGGRSPSSRGNSKQSNKNNESTTFFSSNSEADTLSGAFDKLSNLGSYLFGGHHANANVTRGVNVERNTAGTIGSCSSGIVTPVKTQGIKELNPISRMRELRSNHNINGTDDNDKYLPSSSSAAISSLPPTSSAELAGPHGDEFYRAKVKIWRERANALCVQEKQNMKNEINCKEDNKYLKNKDNGNVKDKDDTYEDASIGSCEFSAVSGDIHGCDRKVCASGFVGDCGVDISAMTKPFATITAVFLKKMAGGGECGGTIDGALSSENDNSSSIYMQGGKNQRRGRSRGREGSETNSKTLYTNSDPRIINEFNSESKYGSTHTLRRKVKNLDQKKDQKKEGRENKKKNRKTRLKKKKGTNSKKEANRGQDTDTEPDTCDSDYHEKIIDTMEETNDIDTKIDSIESDDLVSHEEEEGDGRIKSAGRMMQAASLHDMAPHSYAGKCAGNNTQIGMVKDSNITKSFLEEISSSGIVLTWHAAQRLGVFGTNPVTVKVFIHIFQDDRCTGLNNRESKYNEAGNTLSDGNTTDSIPRLVWNIQNLDSSKDEIDVEGDLATRLSSNNKQHSIPLLEVISVKRTSLAKLKPYPLAVPGRSLSVSMGDGSVFLFEARNEAESKRVVVGLRHVVARLTFNLIIGNSNACTDILHTTTGLKTVCAKEKHLELMKNVTDKLVESCVSRLAERKKSR